MSNLLLFAFLGLGQGALIAGIAVGVVVTYRGSGVINLATGAVAMVTGYLFWALTSGYFGLTVPVGVAFAAALVAAVLVGLTMQAAVFTPLRTASPLARLAASLGILLTLQAGVLLVFGNQPQQEPSVLPDGTVAFGAVAVPVDRFLLAGAVVAVTAGLAAMYRWTRFGLATRAAAENAPAAALAGLPAETIAAVNTCLAALAAGLLGILAAPIIQVDSTTMPLQVVPALAAALLARFTSLGVAATAGLLLGVVQSLLYYLATQSWFPTDNGNALPGIAPLLVFAVIVAALFVRGASLPGRGDVAERRLPAVPLPERLARPAVLSGGLAVVALVVFPFDFRQALTNSLIGALIVLSYVVITGYLGQISVMQVALSGTAGFLVAHLATRWHVPFPAAPLLAAAIATLVGVAAGVSALRVRGVSLAVVTLAAALAIEQALFLNTSFGGTSGLAVPSPHLFGLNLGPDGGFRGLDGKQPSPTFGFLVLAVTVAAGLYVAHLRRTTLGRQMLAVRANERAAAGAGINVRAVKVTAFAISSFIAGVAGSLYGYNFASVSAVRFTALAALALIGFAYVGGITMVSGAVIAGLLAVEGLVPHALESWFGIKGNWALLFGGVSLVLTLLANPDGIAGANHRRAMARRAARAAARADRQRRAALAAGTDQPGGVLLGTKESR